MTTLAAIRTHRWGEDEARIAAQLRPVFGERLAVVFHNRPAGLEPPLPVVDLTDAWVEGAGLRAVHDYGWRCGDYAYYALRTAFPACDHYWLIEPDLVFCGPVADFFARFADCEADALGVRFGGINALHRFARSMPAEIELKRAIFALTRFSGRALDRLFALRRAYGRGGALQRNFVNDEIFCFSHVAADPRLTIAAMADLAPEWFATSQVETDPDVLLDVIAGRTDPGIFHPVRALPSFREAVAKRVVSHAHFFANLKASLALMTDEDIVAIAQDVAGRTEAVLRHQRDAALAEEARAARLLRRRRAGRG